MRSYIPFLSLRYLRHHKLSSSLGILGVTLGVGLVIVVVAVMDGFQERLRRMLLGTTAAVVVEPNYDLDAVALAEAIKARIPGVIEASPVVITHTLIESDFSGRSRRQPVMVQGIDAPREGRVGDFKKHLHLAERNAGPLSLRVPATVDSPFSLTARESQSADRVRKGKMGIVVGYKLLNLLRARVGDELTLYTLRAGAKNREGGAFIAEKFKVTGEFRSGDFATDKAIVFMDRRDALSYFNDGLPLDASELRLLLSDVEQADAVAKALNDKEIARGLAEASSRGGFIGPEPIVARTWKELHYVLLGAVENERGLLLVITSFSFIVVAFLIGSTQSMLVVEKTREIGVLRSLGASMWGTSTVFLGNGFFIGAIGAGLGFLLGSGVANNVPWIIQMIKVVFGRDLFPQDLYQFEQVPIRVDPIFALSICGAAVVFALLGAILPALRAASLDPVSSLHHE